MIVAVMALAVALAIKPSSQTTESTSVSQLSQSGLKLTLMTNATTIHSSQSIDAIAIVYNVLTQNSTVYPNSTLYGNVPDWSKYYVGPCVGARALALSIAIFRGHYTIANLSSTANPLMLIPPQASQCPAIPTLKSLEFQPLSENAEALLDTVTGPQHIQMMLTTELGSACATSNNVCTHTPGVKGYWTGSANPFSTNAALHYFDPGSYTIVAADSWGQTVYLYFIVV